ncbi:DUF3192 domain-containing protein [Candidatus Omnitrophota bacterium]
MNKILVLALCCIFLGFSSPENLRTQNRTNLIKLTPGMTKAQVLHIMQQNEAEDFDEDGTYAINNPYKSETLKGKRKTFEVVYYHTEVIERDRILERDELTPVIFFENKLLGWGWMYLREIVRDNEIIYKFIDEV